MASLNKLHLIGNLGGDAVIKDVGGGTVAEFSLATTDAYTTKSGEHREETEWHSCVLWGKAVGAIGQYLKKGKQVYVEGSSKTRSWETDSGEKRYKTECKVFRVLLLGSMGEAPAPSPELTEDDIPF
jgi:single-strand DNA-binding protein